MTIARVEVIASKIDPDRAQKDLSLALQGAKSLSMPLPNTATAQELFNTCVARGGKGWDHWVMVRALEIMQTHDIDHRPEKSLSQAQ